MPAKKPFLTDFAYFPLHFLIGTGGMFFLGMVVFMGLSVAHSLVKLDLPNLGTAYNPFFWVPAGITGFLVNRSTRNRSACFIGLLAIAFLVARMFWDVSTHKQSKYYSHLVEQQYGGHYWRYEIQQQLSPSDAACGGSECLGKALFTVPVVTAVAYSIGAWFGLRSKRARVGDELGGPPLPLQG
jgi:hypothetical protein